MHSFFINIGNAVDMSFFKMFFYEKETKGRLSILEVDCIENLSDEILNAGYDIYSTICIIRDHNAWAKEHPECLQQSYLSTEPVIAAEEPLTVKPMAGFFDEQFKINDRPEALRYWQVWDRTANKLLHADTWQWEAAAGTVTVACPVPFPAYTVS